MSLVKPAATYLISSAMLFLLSVIFLRSLAIHADYVPSTTAPAKFREEGFGKLLHPICHGNVVNPVFYAAECRLRWHSVFEHAHLLESTKIAPAEIDYVHAPDTPRRPGEYYQNQHVAEPMADVPLIRPSS